MEILVDTREQLPYWKTNRKTLIVGDYTTHRLQGRFHIERKSGQDLYGTITRSNVRFKKEVWRAWERGITLAIYVECTKKQFVEKLFRGGSVLKFPTHGLEKLIATFSGPRYNLEFVWHRSRNGCRAAVVKRLQKEERGLRRNRK